MIYDCTKNNSSEHYDIEANSIGEARRAARLLFGSGVSFSVYEHGCVSMLSARDIIKIKDDGSLIVPDAYKPYNELELLAMKK